MTVRPLPANTGFVFDDEPLESILYDDPGAGAGPTPAGLFASSEPFVSKILQAFEREEVDEGLHGMAELFACGDPVSASNLNRFAVLIGSFIPSVPCPIVQDRGVPYGALLEHLFAAGLACDGENLVQRAGTLLYRLFEGCGRYGDAARVVGTLLDWSNQRGKSTRLSIGSLANLAHHGGHILTGH